MNEDEAFIRAIVDKPGDDTGRLVYADWLDEHDDPRGAYLRAECEWAKPWRKGKPPGDSSELRKLATGLDPLWVARMSRPPMGACCDHLRFSNANPAVSADELDSLESRLKLSLPVELRAILLNYNGGKPIPDGYKARWRKPTDDPDSIMRFYSVLIVKPDPQTGKTRIVNETIGLEYTTTVLNNGLVAQSTNAEAYKKWTSGVREFVTLAEPGAGLGVIAIGLAGKRANKVYEFNRSLMIGSSAPKLLADSLAQFLATITISG